jgi:multidrug efflux pump subunit AcrA (membrane-fusion protein)
MGLAWVFSRPATAALDSTSSMIVTLSPMDLDVKIKKDGELAAVNNIDIMSEVEGSTTIQTLVKEGATVKKGDVLITLDSSAIKQKIEDTTLDLQKAEADLTTSRDLREIQESTNAANLEAADVALTLAKLDLKQYEEGTYPQMLANAKTELEMARITLKNEEEKLGQTKQLFNKGFVTATAIKENELQVTTARNGVAKAETALNVLTDYTHQMDSASKQNALSQAEQKLQRTKRENASGMSQRNADVTAKEQALAVLKRRMDHLQEQFDACTIKAPADGLVVYSTSSDRFAENRIQEGATVRERQMLLRLPDTTSMKAVLRVGESQVSRLREGMRARVSIVGIPQPMGATLSKISILADSSGRFWSDVKEYPVDLVLDETPAGLRPGMSTQAELFVDRASGVLAVPLSAIFSAGPDSYVFIRDGDEFRPRKVRIGRTNETHAELIGDSVKQGEQALILQAGQGQALLDKAGIKVTPTSQPSDSEFGAGDRRRNGARRNGDGNGPAVTPEQPSGGEAQPQQPQQQRQRRRRDGGGGDGQPQQQAPGGAAAAPAPAPTQAPAAAAPAPAQ